MVAPQVCLMALGHASPEHYTVLFEELPLLMDEYQRPGKQKRGNARPEEVRAAPWAGRACSNWQSLQPAEFCHLLVFAACCGC